jgi:hypothetical protein
MSRIEGYGACRNRQLCDPQGAFLINSQPVFIARARQENGP